MMDTLAAIALTVLALWAVTRGLPRPVTPLTDEQKIEQRRRDERRARDRVNAAYELEGTETHWWI